MKTKEEVMELMLKKTEEILNSEQLLRPIDEVNELLKIVEASYDIQEN